MVHIGRSSAAGHAAIVAPTAPARHSPTTPVSVFLTHGGRSAIASAIPLKTPWSTRSPSRLIAVYYASEPREFDDVEGWSRLSS